MLQNIVLGMNIIARYEPSAKVAAEYRLIYCGKTPPADMAMEDMVMLKYRGWRWDDMYEMWYYDVEERG